MRSSSGSTAAAAASAAATKAACPGGRPSRTASACVDAARKCLDAANGDARLAHDAVLDTKGCERHGERKVTGPAIELVKSAMGALIGRTGRRTSIEKLVLPQRRGHDAAEKIARGDGTRAAMLRATISPSSAAATEAPFRCGIGMREAAAECAARADRIMRDVTHNDGEEKPRADLRRTGL